MKQFSTVLSTINSSKSVPLPAKPPPPATKLLAATSTSTSTSNPALSAPPAPNRAENAKLHSSNSYDLSKVANISSVGNSVSPPVETHAITATTDTSTDNVVKPLTPPSPEKSLGLQSSSYFNPPSLARRAFQKDLAKLPLYSYLAVNPNRRAHYIRSSKDFKTHTDRFLSQGVTVVGFDLEWKPMRNPGEYNRVSLVQIASESEVLLIQITGLKHFPPDVKKLLENPDILKVGAGIANDVEKLAIDWSVLVANYIDLADLARSVDPFWAKCDALSTQTLDGAFGIEFALNVKNEDINSISNGSSNSKSSPLSSSVPTPTETENSEKATNEYMHLQPSSNLFQYRQGPPIALVRLVARYQGRRLDKDCQLSNWAAPLSKLQVQYAANDGYAGLDVYHAIMKLRHAMASNVLSPNSILTMGMLHTPNYLPDQAFAASSSPAFTSALVAGVNNNWSGTTWLPSSSPNTSHSSTSTTNRATRRRRRASKSPKSSPTNQKYQPVQHYDHNHDDVIPQKVYPSPPDTPSSSAANVDIDAEEQFEASVDVEDVDGNVQIDGSLSIQQWTDELKSMLPSVSADTSGPIMGNQSIVPILSDTIYNSNLQGLHTRKHSTGQHFPPFSLYPLVNDHLQALPQPQPQLPSQVTPAVYYHHLVNGMNPAQPVIPFYLSTLPTLPTLPTQSAHSTNSSQPSAPPANPSHVPGYTMATSHQQWPAQMSLQSQQQQPGMWMSAPNLGDRRMTWHAGLPGYSYSPSALPNQVNPNPNPHPHPHQLPHSFTWPSANFPTPTPQTTGVYATYPGSYVPHPVYGSYYEQQQQQQYTAGPNQHPPTQVLSTEGDGSGWITGITLGDTHKDHIHKDPRSSQISLPSQVSQSDTSNTEPLIYS